MTIPGWYTSRSTYNADNGSSGTGSLYSYGSTGSTDRALGDVGSGTTGNILAGVKLVNNTGATITSLDISFAGEQWRTGGSANAGVLSVAQTVDFQYQVANPGVVTDANAPLTAGWVDYDPLDFTSPKFGTNASAALDGNAAANRVLLSSRLTVTVNPGQEIWLRWLDINHADNDHGMAIDDFSVTANGAGSTNPSGVGAANPGSVLADGTSTTLLTVSVTPGASPVSTGLAVSADLSPIGGSPAQQFYDDGTHGDVTAGDRVFSFRTSVPSNTAGSNKTLNATITDAQSRTGSASISLNVLAPTPPSAAGAANPNPVQAGNSSLLTVTVTPGTNPTSTGLTVTGDLSSIGGSQAQQFYDDGTHGDTTAGNNVFSYNAAVPSNTAAGLKVIPVQVADAQSRSASSSISLSIQEAPTPAGAVVISQIYGGGGNSGSTYKNDFIEIFNRSDRGVDLTGWSVQYASSTGTTWQVTPLTSVVLAPGQYYLVREAPFGGGTTELPQQDAPAGTSAGSINMGATNGKVALVRTTTALSGGNPLGNSNLMDFVGYGSADFFEGAGAAPALSNTTAGLRARGGCKDTDYNAANFTAVAPTPRNTSSPANPCPVGDEAPEVFSSTPAAGATNVSLTSNVVLNFDQPVSVSGNWFQISCPTSGLHTATVTGGPTTFTLNPDADFAGNEQCTVTVFAGQVTDLDTQDPPDSMAADFNLNFSTLIPRDPAEHLVMGNPSNAGTSDNNNYLLLKEQYVHSYNCERGTPNWVSWHLDQSWLGNAPRQDDFRGDPQVPAPCYQVQGTDYQGSGFDRGHMTPSADRTSTIADNSATFFMSNMVPQAPNNNQGPWEDLESHARQLVAQGNELYIISGPAGEGGVGRNGAADRIANGNVMVPKWTWKVILVLPNAAGNDVARVSTSTRAIAIIMPNDQNAVDINGTWQKYLATVDQVEALTGYNFFSNVPADIQNVIEARLDDANDTAPVADGQSVTTAEDTQKAVTLTASDFNVNNVLTYTVVDAPAHGVLSGTGANLTYTPAADYNGTDSFTFKVNDGDKDSNTATVNINVTPVNDAPLANADSATTDEDSGVTLDVIANDTDVENDTLTATGVGTPAHGAAALVGGGSVRYTPEANYNGADSFTYTVSDGHGGTTTGTVNVTVNPVNDAPVLSGVPATANVPELATYTFPAQATDVDGDALTFSLVGAPAGASINPSTGQFNWTPTEAQGGTGLPYSFTVRVFDGTVNVDTPVTITVMEVNEAPTLAAIGNKTVFLGGTLAFTASGADADLPAQTLTYSLTGSYPAGASINAATGAFTWTPTAAQAGQTYTFGVRVTDNGPGQLSAEQPVTVGAAYTWSGFLQPIRQDGSSVFQAGQTIPVKFQLTGASAGVTGAVARLYLAKVSDQVTGTEESAGSTSSATQGNLFRYSDGQYIFNLSTDGLTAGTYQLRVDTGDGVPRIVQISLR